MAGAKVGATRAGSLAYLLVLGAATAFAAAAALQPWVDPRLLFMDPGAAAERSGDCCAAYYGLMSNLGVLGWTLTAGATLFAAALLHGRGARLAAFLPLGLAGAISLLFALDDLLTLHEVVLPRLGVPQVLVLGTLAGLAGVYGLLQLRLLLSWGGAGLTLAFGLLAASLGVDVVLEDHGDGVRVLEDVFKFVGIAAWLAFHVHAAARMAEKATH